MSESDLLVCLHKEAVAPENSDGSVGYDLRSVEEVQILPGRRKKVSTGLSIKVPAGTYGRIAPRSSLAARYIDVCAGVVDRSYTGIVIVMLHNAGHDSYTVKPGDRIAQLILERVAMPRVVVVDQLAATARGGGGFGSTGR